METLAKSDKQNEYEKKLSLGKILTQKENEFKELALMKAREQLDDGEFMAVKGSVKQEIDGLRKELEALRNIDPQKLYHGKYPILQTLLSDCIAK